MRIFALGILVENKLKLGVFIAPTKFCPLAAGKGKFASLTVRFLTVVPLVDRPGRPRLDKRAELSAGRPARSTGAISRDQSSLDDRPPG